MALRIKRTGQRTSPTLPPVKHQVAVVIPTNISVVRHKARMTEGEIAEVREWLKQTAFGARVAERTGMLRHDVVSILSHAHP